jgi:hypothetical protein
MPVTVKKIVLWRTEVAQPLGTPRPAGAVSAWVGQDTPHKQDRPFVFRRLVCQEARRRGRNGPTWRRRAHGRGEGAPGRANPDSYR